MVLFLGIILIREGGILVIEKIKRKFGKNNQSVEEVEEIELRDEEVKALKEKAESMDEESVKKFGKHYSKEELWNKIKKYAKKLGSSAVYAVLLLYFVLQKEEVPKKNKMIILGALGYFILPFDLIPDVAAALGYTDDIGVLITALVQVATYIDDDVKQKAKHQVQAWFGEDVNTSEIDNRLA